MYKTNNIRYQKGLAELRHCERAMYGQRMFNADLTPEEQRAKDEIITLCHSIAEFFPKR